MTEEMIAKVVGQVASSCESVSLSSGSDAAEEVKHGWKQPVLDSAESPESVKLPYMRGLHQKKVTRRESVTAIVDCEKIFKSDAKEDGFSFSVKPNRRQYTLKSTFTTMNRIGLNPLQRLTKNKFVSVRLYECQKTQQKYVVKKLEKEFIK